MHALRSALLAIIALTACSDPLAPGYLVLFTSGVSASQESACLAKRYGLEVTQVFEEMGGFAAAMKPGAVAQLRCRRTVAAVSRDGSTTFAALPSPTP